MTQNSFPIRSVIYDEDFSDLQFLKSEIGNRPIVQLGESSHGTREFNQVKTRIIKFLHQEMDFEVVAFESGFFEGYHADQNLGTFSPSGLQNFIFGVWSTNEVLELFRYVDETQSTSRPLRLAGFDVQISSPAFYNQLFPFIANLPDTAILTPELRSSITQNLNQYRANQNDHANAQCFGNRSQECSDIIEASRPIIGGLTSDLNALGDPANLSSRDMRALYITISAARGQIRNNAANFDTGDNGNTRDAGMARTFELLRENLFPNEKTVIWAHNRHIAHEESATQAVQGNPFFFTRPMGFALKNEYQDDIFSIGLYMLRGQTANNFGQPLSVLAPRNDSLEAIAYSRRLAALYFSTGGDQPQVAGNSFIFERTQAHYWGGEFGTYSMIPKDQFDGLIVIDQSSVPQYR